MNSQAELARSVVVDTRRSAHTRHQPLAISDVSLEGGFWSPRLATTRDITMRQQYKKIVATGRLFNFQRAAGKIAGEFQGRFYNDSDVYKWIEAGCFALASGADAGLADMLDGVIAEIADAQSSDGYLNSYFVLEREKERWTDLPHLHELYCAGHLIQAAIAHHRTTGSRRFLDVAVKLADHIVATFGPGRRPGTDGHEEIELALVELFRELGDRRYLDQARFFLDQRGTGFLLGRAYFQDHLPVRQQSEIVGHAVRATYLACGMVDAYAETGESALFAAAERLWESAFARKAYITGGLGARWEGEAFGDDFELPSESAYAETCAAIGGFMWNWRMLLVTGESRYADWMESALYNGILAGISLDGSTYFYQNPLADRGGHRRQPWFGTACCPPNIARLLLSLPGYLATDTDGGLAIHHYASGTIRTVIAREDEYGSAGQIQPRGASIAVRVATDYPWDGRVTVTVEEAPSLETSISLRVPGWCTGATVSMNGGAVEPAASWYRRLPRDDGGQTLTPRELRGYARVSRVWRAGDTLTLDLPMPARMVPGDSRVEATAGHVALARGPLVYCVEQVDCAARDPWGVTLEPDASFITEHRPDLLGGVVVLRGEATRPPGPPVIDRFPVTAVPYYAWANREPGSMAVWFRVLE